MKPLVTSVHLFALQLYWLLSAPENVIVTVCECVCVCVKTVCFRSLDVKGVSAFQCHQVTDGLRREMKLCVHNVAVFLRSGRSYYRRTLARCLGSS